MLRRDFHFKLPPELIAQYPAAQRGASRLLILDGASGALRDGVFTELPSLLRPGDLLVCNDAWVIPARLYGRKATGGKVEILVERLLDERRALAHVRGGRSLKPGDRLSLADDKVVATALGRRDELFELSFDDPRPAAFILEQHGETPLPPYIERSADADDRDRYQTVYARRPGAVAAPTAGLHFEQGLLDKLKANGVELAFVTLYVGAGTFSPVRVERIEQHVMHSERVEVDATVCEQVRAARRRGGRVVAVGTTAVRSLESAWREDDIQPLRGETRLFIYPGYRFRCVDALITNFHLPESTLLMLVAAFAGHANILRAYRHAVTRRYRFFSYGDAMFITRRAA